MSGLIFGSKGTNAAKVQKYTSLSVQTSTLGKAITIMWGQARLTFNLIWSNDFKAHKVKQAGGKGGMVGGGKGAKSYTYSVAISMGICEGPVQSVGTVYQNQSTTTLGALNLTLYTGTATQTPPGYIVTNHPTEAEAYPYTAYLFSSKYDLGSSQSLPQLWAEVTGALSGTMPSTPDANWADIIADLLSNTQYGMDSAGIGLDATTWGQYKTYCRAQGLFASPVLESQEQCTAIIDRWAQLSNSWIFWSGAGLKFVPLGDSTITANGVTYTPDNQVRYHLTVDDFLDQNQPIVVTMKDPADSYNRLIFEIEDRSNKYSTYPCEYRDQTLVDKYGLRDASSVTAHEYKTQVAGNVAVNLAGKRAAYLRREYAFKLPFRFLLLEAGDIVTLTDPNNAAITDLPVRITKGDCDKDRIFSFTAEEFTGSIGTVAPAVSQSSGPADFNRLVDPGDVNPPAVFEPNSALTGGKAQIWTAASGGATWGGADMYISFDSGTTYVFAGSITTPALQGVLTGTLASHADPDSTNTLAIDLTQSQGVITAATHADADALRTLSLVVAQPVAGAITTAGAELLSYGAVAATGTYTSNLTYLRRGKYGTVPAAHASGDQFTQIDLTGAQGSTLIYDLPAAYIGATIYLKFQSYNIYGLAQQDLSTVTAYHYTPTGAGFGGGTGGVPVTPTGLAASGGTGQNTVSWTSNGATDNVTAYKLFAAPGLSQPFGSATLIWQGLATTYVHSGLASATAYTYFLEATNAAGDSAHTTGVNSTSSTVLKDLRMMGGLPGTKPAALFEFFNPPMKTGDKLASGLPGSELACEIAPTSNWTVTLAKNGSSIGTGTILAGATTGTWTFAADVTFADGDKFTLTAPTPADATLSGPSYTILGTRTQ